MTEAKQTFRLSELQSALGWVVLVQVVILMLTALLLDGGYCGRICGCAMGGYWLMLGWLALRRRNALTATDAVLIRYGFIIWLMIAFLVEMTLEYFLHV